MPNGINDGINALCLNDTRVFTKLLKPSFCSLREQGYSSVVYFDDTLLAEDTYAEYNAYIKETSECLKSLGFTLHPIKSSFFPSPHLPHRISPFWGLL